jgi:hypothetical protein
LNIKAGATLAGQRRQPRGQEDRLRGRRGSLVGGCPVVALQKLDPSLPSCS